MTRFATSRLSVESVLSEDAAREPAKVSLVLRALTHALVLKMFRSLNGIYNPRRTINLIYNVLELSNFGASRSSIIDTCLNSHTAAAS